MKVILDFIAGIAWPLAILTIAVMYRKPIYALLQHFGGIAERAITQPFKAEMGNFKVEFKQAVAAKNPQSVQDAVDAAADVANDLVPYGTPVPGRPGLVESPYSPGKYISVEGFPPGTEVIDPYTSRIFRVPVRLFNFERPNAPLRSPPAQGSTRR